MAIPSPVQASQRQRLPWHSPRLETLPPLVDLTLQTFVIPPDYVGLSAGTGVLPG